MEDQKEIKVEQTPPETPKTSKQKKPTKKQLVSELLAKSNSKVFIANWKMNNKFADIKAYFKKFNKLIGSDKTLKTMGNVLIGVAPTTIGLLPVVGMARKGILTVAQNVYHKENGSYTGCISYDQVHEYNINYAVVGHYETRTIFNLKEADVNEVVKSLVNNQMTPILCIGETTEEKDNGLTQKVLSKQLLNDLKDVSANQALNVIIAYEPIWAIGKSPATNDEIDKNIKMIREIIGSIYDSETAKNIHILYGGSVDENNAAEILTVRSVDGFLVGRAGLDPLAFYKIIKSSPEYIESEKILKSKNK